MAYKKYLTKEDKLKALSRNNRKYYKTKKGKLMITYNNMNRRVRGYVKPHLYKGLELLSRESFYKFSNESVEFNSLYDNWVNSGYDRKLSPSIDRRITSKGYTLDNMRWITHSENSKQGVINRHKTNKL